MLLGVSTSVSGHQEVKLKLSFKQGPKGDPLIKVALCDFINKNKQKDKCITVGSQIFFVDC